VRQKEGEDRTDPTDLSGNGGGQGGHWRGAR
jgi:hypothetical protein